jgi:hypothetical protein
MVRPEIHRLTESILTKTFKAVLKSFFLPLPPIPFFMKICLCIAVFCLLLFWGSGCRHEPKKENLPQVSFANQVEPIINANCAYSGCHNGGEEFSLLGYDNVRRNVKPGKPFSSKLYSSITALNAIQAMPPPEKPALSETQLQIIYIWIQNGAPNN